MNKIKILVVEDEVIIADNLCDIIGDLGYEALEPALNYTEALKIIDKKNPDIIILDIQLGGKKTGIDLAKEIIKSYNMPYIFLTSNSDKETIKEVKELNPPAYIMKPFSKEELYASIEIVLHNFSEDFPEEEVLKKLSEDSLFIKEKGVYKKVLLKEVLYLKSEHVYTEVVLKNQKFVIRSGLNAVMNKLNSKFIRIHRSYVINLDCLEQIDKSTIKINGELLPVGNSYKEEFLNSVNLI